MKDHLYEYEIYFFLLKILIKTKLYKALMNPRVVLDQNQLNRENQRKSQGIELCEYYCFGLYKMVE